MQLWDVNTDGTITTPYYPVQNNAAGPYLTLDIGVNSLFFEERLTGGETNEWQWGEVGSWLLAQRACYNLLV